jgi:hypothetical protein
VNVEFLTNRINTATAKPVESFNNNVTTNYDATVTNPEPIISSNYSSPQNSNANYSQPLLTVDDNANFANNNTSNVNDTPTKTLLRSTSIKYSNDADDEPNFSYNESPSFVEQPAYVEQQGKAQTFKTHETDDQIKIQHSLSLNIHELEKLKLFMPQSPHYSFS